ncbi:peptidoglycan editing factor PgeF [Veillonella sp. 3891]|uniref:peptidoglycan editing factor PgeF n=2 Tax=unclassified Veillonella TaxID=2630086 RepID=UPI000F8F0903|nr:peptidoglycan editing factor PgeF [Veillonella sp. 3891]
MNKTQLFQTSSSLHHAPFSQDNSTSITYEYSPLLEHFPLTHGVTYRYGGVSKDSFDSFNMGLHVGDTPEAVAENRKRLAKVLGVDSHRLTCGEQVHGVGVTRVTQELVGRGAFSWDDSIPDSDAIHTNLVNVPLLLLVADCVPVLIYDAVHHAVAVVHAGWRGAIAHIVESTMDSMCDEYGTLSSDCYLFIGPSIGADSFEVSEEIAEQFRQDMYTLGLLPVDQVVRYIQRQGQRTPTPHVNLKRYIAACMTQKGVPLEQVSVSSTDTMTTDGCYSYRRDQGRTGRMAMFAVLRDQA